MATIVRALVFTSMGGGIAITANYFYVRRVWKSEHPLVSEALDLIQKDSKIVEQLGNGVDVRSGISGVLESGKNWANISFTVGGSVGRGKVSILADAKTPSEFSQGQDRSEFPLEGSPPSFTFLDFIKHYALSKPLSKETPNWRILSLHYKVDDTHTIPVIGDGVRSHKDAKVEKEVKGQEQISSQLASRKRREKTYRAAQQRWMMMAGVCGIGFILFLIGRKYMRVHPVANSVFLNQAIDIISTDVWVRNQLGVPIKSLQFVKGALNYNYTKGQCETLVYGPKNYGRLTASGVFNPTSKKWSFSTLKVKIDSDLRSLVAKT